MQKLGLVADMGTTIGARLEVSKVAPSPTILSYRTLGPRIVH